MPELKPRRIDRWVKIDPLNLFMNISRGSEILGKGSNPTDPPGKYNPSGYMSYRASQSDTLEL